MLRCAGLFVQMQVLLAGTRVLVVTALAEAAPGGVTHTHGRQHAVEVVAPAHRFHDGVVPCLLLPLLLPLPSWLH